MPDYPDHNDFEKYQTVVMQSTCLMTALKLIDYNRFFAPFSLKNSTLNDLENAEESSVEFILNHPFQIPMATFSKGRSKSRITSKEIEWVGNAMTTMNKLFFNDDFTTTMEAMSYYYGDLPVRAKMMLIWSAIEDLLRPKKSIRYGVKKRFAMILGKTDEERKELHDLVDSLYQKRNSATHGRKFAWVHGVEDIFENNELQLDLSTLIYSYQLLCDLFYQIVDNGRRYTDDELIRMDEEYEEKFPNKRSKS